MTDTVVVEDERAAARSAVDHKVMSLNQARLLLRAAINFSRSGRKEVAVELFEGAQKKFESCNENVDAGIARAWATGLRERLGQTAFISPHL
jgi:hypothetical protein